MSGATSGILCVAQVIARKQWVQQLTVVYEDPLLGYAKAFMLRDACEEDIATSKDKTKEQRKAYDSAR